MILCRKQWNYDLKWQNYKTLGHYGKKLWYYTKTYGTLIN